MRMIAVVVAVVVVIVDAEYDFGNEVVEFVAVGGNGQTCDCC